MEGHNSMNLDDYYDFRDGLADAVLRDLVGPPHGEEPREDETTLYEAPMTRYIAGVLYPQSPDPVDEVMDNEHDDIKRAEADDYVDAPVAMANVQYPSAMGLTFAVDRGASSTLTVKVQAARYEKDDPGDKREKWNRVAVSCDQVVELAGVVKDHNYSFANGLRLYVRERTPDAAGISAVTVALINTLQVPLGEWQKDPYCYFQCDLGISADDTSAFVDRSKVNLDQADDDGNSFALLYRNSPSFAAGHGCGAMWDHEPGEQRAHAIRSSFTPSHDLLLADNNPDVSSPFFGMHKLATATRGEVATGLREFVAGYEEWITERRADIDDLDGVTATTATRHLKECSIAADRIGAGIRVLEQDDFAWKAFQLANQAMHDQRAQAAWIQNGRQGVPNLADESQQWRAFQIGFFLMTLRGVAEPESEDRSTVDLLWFPTGGGKTEAYLGLIAFTIFLRRLRAVKGGGKGDGLTVIMRYTLRLLTLQQFQRASLLICACEALRRRAVDELGKEEISICLWVGKAATPLKLADAKKALGKLKGGAVLEEDNPMQLRECPWCATPLDADNYYVADYRKRLVITCKNSDCEFEKGLPCYLVDEDVYNLRPTLMIATVDKFASLPWRDTVGSLFNVHSVESPPELIIQDELHLISGPLGTMVGLYETAVQMLCTDGGIGPKIIASTATIRRAEQQIKSLYGSRSFQFPPPGLHAADSYFAIERAQEDKGTRRYLGLMAPGTSHATLLVRSYAAALQAAKALPGPDSVRDPYWTMLGYFNSLRVLGGAMLQVRDDVTDRIEVLAQTMDTDARFDGSSLEMIEMNSRIESSKIPEHLERMARTKGEDGALDVILATNMISVGVDIDRLGLMAVMGQPQSASEYIQATSRVGRRFPGLVFVLMNAARSRDRSHYEDFVSFHNSLYRQVDASSVTPFAARARDRGLHAVFIGMMRARYNEFSANTSANNVANLDAQAAPIKKLIVDRVQLVDPEEAEHTATSIDQIVADWKRRASDQPNLKFADYKKPELALLQDASRPEAPNADSSFSTMWSLRAVDTESNLYLAKD